MTIRKKKTPTPPPIKGIITPLKCDIAGKPLRIAIRTVDDEDYEIDFSGAGKELLSLTHREVAVEGVLRQQLNGRLTLRVLDYQVINNTSENKPFNYQKN